MTHYAGQYGGARRDGHTPPLMLLQLVDVLLGRHEAFLAALRSVPQVVTDSGASSSVAGTTTATLTQGLDLVGHAEDGSEAPLEEGKDESSTHLCGPRAPKDTAAAVAAARALLAPCLNDLRFRAAVPMAPIRPAGDGAMAACANMDGLLYQLRRALAEILPPAPSLHSSRGATLSSSRKRDSFVFLRGGSGLGGRALGQEAQAFAGALGWCCGDRSLLCLGSYLPHPTPELLPLLTLYDAAKGRGEAPPRLRARMDGGESAPGGGSDTSGRERSGLVSGSSRGSSRSAKAANPAENMHVANLAAVAGLKAAAESEGERLARGRLKATIAEHMLLVAAELKQAEYARGGEEPSDGSLLENRSSPSLRKPLFFKSQLFQGVASPRASASGAGGQITVVLAASACAFIAKVRSSAASSLRDTVVFDSASRLQHFATDQLGSDGPSPFAASLAHATSAMPEPVQRFPCLTVLPPWPLLPWYLPGRRGAENASLSDTLGSNDEAVWLVQAPLALLALNKAPPACRLLPAGAPLGRRGLALLDAVATRLRIHQPAECGGIAGAGDHRDATARERNVAGDACGIPAARWVKEEGGEESNEVEGDGQLRPSARRLFYGDELLTFHGSFGSPSGGRSGSDNAEALNVAVSQSWRLVQALRRAFPTASLTLPTLPALAAAGAARGRFHRGRLAVVICPPEDNAARRSSGDRGSGDPAAMQAPHPHSWPRGVPCSAVVDALRATNSEFATFALEVVAYRGRVGGSRRSGGGASLTDILEVGTAGLFRAADAVIGADAPALLLTLHGAGWNDDAHNKGGSRDGNGKGGVPAPLPRGPPAVVWWSPVPYPQSSNNNNNNNADTTRGPSGPATGSRGWNDGDDGWGPPLPLRLRALAAAGLPCHPVFFHDDNGGYNNSSDEDNQSAVEQRTPAGGGLFSNSFPASLLPPLRDSRAARAREATRGSAAPRGRSRAALLRGLADSVLGALAARDVDAQRTARSARRRNNARASAKSEAKQFGSWVVRPSALANETASDGPADEETP